MSQTYQALEGELSIRGATTATRAGQTNAVAIVGGYDESNAASEVTTNEATRITDPTTASDTFGASEIAREAQAIAANGVGTIYGVPVPETQTTETVSTSSSATLAESPVFDPTVHPDHEILVTDTDAGADLTVNIVYDDAPSTPTKDNTANVNPINGEVAIDTSGNYDITYTYGEYADAISTAGDLNVAAIHVGTEAPSVKSTLQTELADRAQDFDFIRGYVGATPDIGPTDIGDYTPDVQDWRIVEVAPSRASGASGAVRTAAAVAGFMASQPIGPDGSGLYDAVGGITSLNTEYRPSEAKDFNGVTSLTRNGLVARAKTTSTEEQFEDIYAVEIIDNVALGLFNVARSYAGGPQDTNELETLLSIQCQSFATGNPPQLGFGDGRSANPYDVTVSLGTDTSVADAGVTIVPYPIAETVNLSITVSDGFVQFEGASA